MKETERAATQKRGSLSEGYHTSLSFLPFLSMVKKRITYIIGILLFVSSVQAQTIMTREEAAVYALRAASALNTSVRWLSTPELPAGEEVADTENDKIDFYALQGLDYEDIVSINTSSPLFVCFSNWLRDVNYIYPANNGYIFVNAFSGEVVVRGEFPTNVTGPLDEKQAVNIASEIVNSFYGSIDHEWIINVKKEYNGMITVFFTSHKPSIGLKLGRRYAFIRFSPQGFVYEAYFFPLGDDIVHYATITMEEAKQLVVNALEEAYASGKEVYEFCMGQKTKLPKVRFICLGKHPEASEPDINSIYILPIIEPLFKGEGIYFHSHDSFLQPKYVYAVLVTIEIEDYNMKVWTYYLVDIITGEVEGCGLQDIYLVILGGSGSIDESNRFFGGIKPKIIILNNQKLQLYNTFFEDNRIYISQDYLQIFKAQLQDNKLYGRNGEICLNTNEIRQIKGKTYIPLRRVCEVSGIRLWWDNERKVPILRAEWLEPRRLLAQRR